MKKAVRQDTISELSIRNFDYVCGVECSLSIYYWFGNEQNVFLFILFFSFFSTVATMELFKLNNANMNLKVVKPSVSRILRCKSRLKYVKQ